MTVEFIALIDNDIRISMQFFVFLNWKENGRNYAGKSSAKEKQ